MPYSIKISRKRSLNQPSCRIPLLNLPTELLLVVLGHVQTARDLYAAANVCTQLRVLALPLFLERHQIRSPHEEIATYVMQWDPAAAHARPPDALSGLNIAHHITKANRLQFFFQDPASTTSRNTFQQVFHLPYAVDRTHTFLSGLQAIDTAEIYLVWDAYFTLSERSINYIPWSELKKWTSSFELMLNTVIERGCRSLTVQYDAAIKPSFKLKQPKKVVKYLSHGTDLDVHWQFERHLREDGKALAKEPEPTAVLSPAARSANGLEHLSIHSPVLLTPPFLRWTISLCQAHTQLTSLSFAYIAVEPKIWSTVLPLLASSLSTRLTRLSFHRNCPHIEARDLLQFLFSFPALVHLSIDRILRSRFQGHPYGRKPFYYSDTPPTFPKLQTLQCPVEFLALLMGPSPNSPGADPLPALRSLIVYPCAVTMTPSAFSSMKSPVFITEILDRIMGYTRPAPLDCALDAKIEFKEFKPVVEFMEAQRDAVDTALEAGPASTSLSVVTRQALEKWRSSGLPVLCFDHIKHVILFRLIQGQNPRSAGSLTCRWLGVLFPQLERLTVTCRLDAHPVDGYEIPGGTSGLLVLMRELRAACPNVHTLLIGKKSYDITQSLDGQETFEV